MYKRQERDRERKGERFVTGYATTRLAGDWVSHVCEKAGDAHKVRWSHVEGRELSQVYYSQHHCDGP